MTIKETTYVCTDKNEQDLNKSDEYVQNLNKSDEYVQKGKGKGKGFYIQDEKERREYNRFKDMKLSECETSQLERAKIAEEWKEDSKLIITMIKKDFNNSWWQVENRVDEFLPDRFKTQWKSGKLQKTDRQYQNIQGIRNRIQYYLTIFHYVKNYIIKEEVGSYFSEKSRNIQSKEDQLLKNPYQTMHDSYIAIKNMTPDTWVDNCVGANQQKLRSTTEDRTLARIELWMKRTVKAQQICTHLRDLSKLIQIDSEDAKNSTVQPPYKFFQCVSYKHTSRAMDGEAKKMQWQKKEMEKIVRENIESIKPNDVLKYKDIEYIYGNLVKEGKIVKNKDSKQFIEDSDSEDDKDDNVSMITSKSRLTAQNLKKMKKRWSFRYSRTGKLSDDEKDDDTMEIDANGMKRQPEQKDDERPKSVPKKDHGSIP